METYDPILMGNWHHDVAVNPSVSTSDLSEPYNKATNLFSNKLKIASQISEIYSTGLKDKHVLDIACNAGAHLFELNRFGIKSGFGFDIRQMWINQAHWLKRNIDFDCSNLEFEHGGFDLLDKFEDAHFHVALFNGIFYHLADPIAELVKVAKKTSELIIVNTAYEPDSNCDSPALICKRESKEIKHGLSGVEGLAWYPNGAEVLFNILKHLGFAHAKILFIHEKSKRLCVLASRVPDLI